jgi:hypothetical protein
MRDCLGLANPAARRAANGNKRTCSRRSPNRAKPNGHVKVGTCLRSNSASAKKEETPEAQRVIEAQKIQTLFIDDIDGGEAEGTVRFGLDGADYEIDLNAKHSEDLRNALANYVAHARKVGGTARRGAARGGRRASTVDTVAARAWAREQGIGIKDRGRVPADVVAKYQEFVGA